jgi:cytoskeletal protein CcmA (bactofilin family)
VAGEVNGDVTVEQKLEIVSSGKVNGNIQCENLVIGEGAVFHGNCEMLRGGAAETAACGEEA